MKTGRQINENNEKQYYLNTGKTLCQDSEGTSIEGFKYDAEYLNQYAKINWVEENFLPIPEEGEYYKKPNSGIPTEDIADEAIEYSKLSLNTLEGIIPPFNTIVYMQVRVLQQSSAECPNYSQIYFSAYHKQFVALVNGRYYASWPNSIIYNGAGIYPNDKQTYHCSSNNRLYFYNAEEETLKELSYDTFDGVVSSNALQDGSITSNKIASGAVTVTKIADLNVTSNKISNSAVTTNKIAPRAVTGEKLDYFCIGAEHISNNFKEVYLQIKQEKGNIDDTSQNLVTIDNEPYYCGSQLINLKKKQVLVVEAILKPQYADSFFEISLINSSKTGVVYPEYSPYSYIPDQDISIYIGFKDGVDADKYALDHIEYTIYDTLESVLERVKQLENNN